MSVVLNYMKRTIRIQAPTSVIDQDKEKVQRADGRGSGVVGSSTRTGLRCAPASYESRKSIGDECFHASFTRDGGGITGFIICR